MILIRLSVRLVLMQLIDTHCHIHSPEFFEAKQAEEVYKESARKLEAMVLVGTNLSDSIDAVSFADEHPEKCFVSAGIHPHEAVKMTKRQIESDTQALAELAKSAKVKAVGECGFDFFYNDRNKVLDLQTQLFEAQIQIAVDLDLPLVFHVREGFDEFWPILTNFSGITGVLHSFSDKQINVDRALQMGLFIGVNGIATFTKLDWQRQIFKDLPLESIVIETDSPFLTPSPIRGTINKPINVTYVTQFLAELKGEDVKQLSAITTTNARRLFRL